MRKPTATPSTPARPTWLISVRLPAPELPIGDWFESLYKDRSRAENTAFTALRWLLEQLGCQALVVDAEDISDSVALAVPARDALAVAVAERVAALFMLTGAFTRTQAEELAAMPHERLMQAMEAPSNIITPAQEALSRWGTVSRGGYAWCWQQLPTNPAVEAGGQPAQGMLRANTESEAIDRLRERFPEAGAFTWIHRRDFVLPAGLQAAFQ